MCQSISRYLCWTVSFRTFCRIMSILGSVFIINCDGFVITRFLLRANALFKSKLILIHLMAYTMVIMIDFNAIACSMLLTIISSIVDLIHYVIYVIMSITYLLQPSYYY